jgi:transcriptional repressor NrdR
MRCPSCSFEDTKVVDSRDLEGEIAIRRRRECFKCGYRFTTFERVEMANLIVVKKDNRREPYAREKLERGILRAAEKRPITQQAITELIAKIESELRGKSTNEVTSKQIGAIVMRLLKRMDKVAYIRYASVYKEFEDIDSLEEELHKLLSRKKTE